MKSSKRKTTIQDVAKKAHVSLSTISLVLNNKPNVGAETRRRIQEVIKALNYHPQRSAQGLASKSSGNIGFILTEDHFSQAEPFYTKIFLGTEFEARKFNYYILLTTVGWTLREPEIPRFLLEHNVDGIIIAGKIGASWVEYIRERSIPIVLIDFDIPRYSISSVRMDNRAGIHLVAEHLWKKGHRKIGFIGGDIHHPSIAERYQTYREMLKSSGAMIRDDWIVIDEQNTSMSDGFESAKKIFIAGQDWPTAIIAANDAMALGCMKFLKESDIAVPDSVAVVGFDNVESGLHSEPRLTTINVHREEMGSVAVRRLVEMIKEKKELYSKTVIPVELVVRESCGKEKHEGLGN
jgi:LacI family transcriptional regulator, galactose operon repressor